MKPSQVSLGVVTSVVLTILFILGVNKIYVRVHACEKFFLEITVSQTSLTAHCAYRNTLQVVRFTWLAQSGLPR